MKEKKVNRKIILFLSLFLVFILFMGAVSASSDMNLGRDDVLTADAVEEVRVALDGATGEDLVSSGDAADALSVNDDSDVLGDVSTYSVLASEIAAGGNVTLQHSLYTYDSGDTITISGDNRVIDGNGAVIDMAGSNIRAFSVRDSGVTIMNLTIKNANYTSTNGDGGAVYINNDGSVVDCSFVNCSASGDGGAVYINNDGSVVDCSFVNCSAGYNGGAVYMHGSGSVVDCCFVNCSASGSGGAVYMYRSRSSMINCSFVDCSASAGGAAVYIGSGSGSVVDCCFVNCSASGSGGAVYMYSSGSVVDCCFVNCSASAGGGGAVYIGVSGYNSSMVNCSFVNCSAGYNGGAVYMYRSGSVVNCSFVNNSGNYRNIYLYTGSLTLEDNKFLDTIITLDNTEFNYGSDFTVNGTLDAGVNVAIDDLRFKLNDTAVHTYTLDVSSDQKFSFPVGGTELAQGTYQITATTDANNNQYTLIGSLIFAVKVNGTVFIEDIKRAVGSPYDAVANFTDEQGNALVDTRVEFIVDGVVYYVVTDSNGTAYLNATLPLIGDVETRYNVTAVNPVTGENRTVVSTIVPRIIVCSGDLSADYLENPPYIVQAIGDDGNPVGENETVTIVFAGFGYDMLTNATGHVVRTIGLAPGMYAVKASYKGYNTTADVFTVNQILKVTSGTLKLTAKSYTLKATLKNSNGKAIAGKEVKLTFNGKSYKVTTNSNGVASYKISSKIINTLKASKTYVLQARYVNDIAKGKIKVVKK